jgi:hypothetical protein
LINAKGGNSENKHKRELFNDKTNQVSAFDAPVSPFKDNK